MAKIKLPLVRRFQCAIICSERTKIGEDIEVDQAQKWVLTAELWSFLQKSKISISVYDCFFVPQRAFLVKPFYPRTLVAYTLGKKIRSPEAFSFLRNNSAKILNAHFPCKFTFLHFVLAV